MEKGMELEFLYHRISSLVEEEIIDQVCAFLFNFSNSFTHLVLLINEISV